MNAGIVIGEEQGRPVQIDIEELLATRLLVQGNSGSGKSHLLRRLLEESAGLVQQIVIDPEGDFVSLADAFNHIVVDASAYSQAELEALAVRVRAHRASVVLALEGLEVEQQIRAAATFLGALFDAPREHWYPALVVVDEAQMFAPSAAGEMAEETRRLTLSAMTNLMCRGRKRGLAGIVATQRLAKLAKNVAAEASNFLMGRTFLDIDMIRAADLLGMERRQAERIRDLERGRFVGLGPAISRRPVTVKIGSVKTGKQVAAAGLMPLPEARKEDMAALLTESLADDIATRSPPPPPRPVPSAETLGEAMAESAAAPVAKADGPAPDTEGTARKVLAEMAAHPDTPLQTASTLYQAFLALCRQNGVHIPPMDMNRFRREFAMAMAGLDRLTENDRERLVGIAEGISDDVLGPYLVIARSTLEGRDAPDDDELARAYGTSSPGRVRRLLDYLEREGLIVVREVFGGGRKIFVPALEAAG
ncbi:ATP-binding protein [Croceicoccus naphthovorans]|uniref:ATP-binding protein n=1 Tax=Croceicoccus naphthovorans TaxID=1348774 RepID=A0A0G3XN17_9SPHN|nr:ATP-binding protein [Croceicoccus naphthovorans]AKM11948.1 ATP-binding protein [Croceicoccus naphthovorans]